MKLFGHPYEESQIESAVPGALAEVVLEASAAELRKIAAFLTTCATHMDEMGSEYGHEHLSALDAFFWEMPHFVVVPPQADGA